jgi:hypothetical protein
MKKIISTLFLLISVAAFADYDHWIYDPAPKDKTLRSSDFSVSDDGTVVGWKFHNMTCDKNTKMLTITRYIKSSGDTPHEVPSTISPLDFSKPIIGTDGETYFLKRFAMQSKYTYNLLNESSTSGVRSPVVSEIILPNTFDTAEEGTIQYFKNATKFEFYGDYKIIEARTFYSCYGCRSIRFHQFPPYAKNNSSFILKQCGGGNEIDADLRYYAYRSRFEYPKYLESAWLNTIYKTDSGVDCALYNIKLDSIPDNYKNSFPEETEGPDGFAWINYYNNAWTGQVALKAFDEENPTDRVVLGVMGLPYETSQLASEVKDYGYGYQELALDEDECVTLPVARPRRWFKVDTEEGEKSYICVGYKLFKDSNAVDANLDENTPDEIIPFDTDTVVPAGNYGLTWIWEEGTPGFKIIVR